MIFIGFYRIVKPDKKKMQMCYTSLIVLSNAIRPFVSKTILSLTIGCEIYNIKGQISNAPTAIIK